MQFFSFSLCFAHNSFPLQYMEFNLNLAVPSTLQFHHLPYWHLVYAYTECGQTISTGDLLTLSPIYATNSFFQFPNSFI
uniref:Uncharacterized protein n=1 Tax=Rhizophora mucronata TaxID=61149 RepID=A0A2P2NJY7_RHIMU